MTTCLNCFLGGKTNINCNCCQGRLHLSCTGLSENDIKMTKASSKSIKVLCNTCNDKLFKDLKFLVASIQADFKVTITSLKKEFKKTD